MFHHADNGDILSHNRRELSNLGYSTEEDDASVPMTRPGLPPMVLGGGTTQHA
jgi:hypothetical protein